MTDRHPAVRQLYVLGGALAFVATFLPLFDYRNEEFDSLTLWSAMATDDGGAAVVGLLLVGGMGLVAAVATRPGHGFGVPVAALGVGAVALVMLVVRPGAGADAALAGGSGLLLGSTVLLMATALADALMAPVRLERADVPADVETE